MTVSAQKTGFGVVNNIEVRGNNRTKTAVVLRELTFQAGDTMQLAQFATHREKSTNQLRNTGLFNSVTIERAETELPASGINVVITLVERWYLWPKPLLENAETNFNSWWQNQDLGRVIYGGYFTQHNLTGRNDRLRIILRQGFTEEYAIEYRPTWIDKAKTFGMTGSLSFRRNKELNTGSLSNQRVFFEASDYQRKEWGAGLAINQRARFANKHDYELEYRHVAVADTIQTIQPDYLHGIKNGLAENSSQQQFFTFGYRFKRDTRDAVYYPLKGSMTELSFRKTGLGLLNSDAVNLLDVTAAFHQHFQLNESLFLAFGLNGKTTVLDPPPYYLQQGLGYGSKMIRGYELYVMDGQHYGLLRSTVKFRPFKGPRTQVNTTILNKNIRQELRLDVYLNLFVDGGIVADDLYGKTNPLSNQWHYGTGAGIDFVTIYDLVLRTEFTRNKRGETGLFLHFMKAI